MYLMLVVVYLVVCMLLLKGDGFLLLNKVCGFFFSVVVCGVGVISFLFNIMFLLMEGSKVILLYLLLILIVSLESFFLVVFSFVEVMFLFLSVL